MKLWSVDAVKRSVFGALGFFLFLTSPTSLATEGWLTVDVLNTQQVGSDILGGCLVKVSPNFQSSGFACPNSDWVTFDCASQGILNSRDSAGRMFETAMLAYVLDTQVKIFVSDDEVINGKCLAKRIMLF